jgi:hypothetical protein
MCTLFSTNRKCALAICLKNCQRVAVPYFFTLTHLSCRLNNCVARGRRGPYQLAPEPAMFGLLPDMQGVDPGDGQHSQLPLPITVPKPSQMFDRSSNSWVPSSQVNRCCCFSIRARAHTHRHALMSFSPLLHIS